MLAAVLAYPILRPNEALPFTEQSAMALVLMERHFASGVARVPPVWFNAYPFDDGSENHAYLVERGDMALHFPGLPNKKAVIHDWTRRLSTERHIWEVPVSSTHLEDHTAQFWSLLGQQQNRTAAL